MHITLDEELKAHPEKNKEQEEKTAELGQELLEKLWDPEEKPTTFWGKVKNAFSDGINLPEKLFDRIVDFRIQHGLAYKKEEMQRVMFYATKAFRSGTEILERGCYLFHHNPQAFEKYATSATDFSEDIHQSTFDEENVFMPAIGIGPVGIAIAAGQSEYEEERAEDRRLPLCSFAPIKFGYHPALMTSQKEIDKYQGLFGEPSLNGFDTNPYRFEPLKKLLYIEQPQSHYPDTQHKAMVIAINAFNQYLEHEPIKVCVHKGNCVLSSKEKQFNE